jgi:hypothetical protein
MQPWCSVGKEEFQRGTHDRDHYVWFSRRVPCVQIAHDIVPILGPRKTREVEVF